MKNPYQELDARILGEVYTSSEPMDNLTVLCDEFGSRWAGTPGDKGAVIFMRDKFKEYGLKNARLEEYKLEGWTRSSAVLEITSPIRKDIPCISLPYNLSGEVEAKLINLEDGAPDVYEKRRDEIEGNIVMVTSRNLIRGIPRRIHRRIKFYHSVLNGAAAFIFKNHYPAFGPATGGVEPVIPAVGVSYEDGEFLTRLVRRKNEVSVRVKTMDTLSEMRSWNVVADLPGTSEGEEYILVGAHYDGHDIAQGAIDPGSGTVVVMEMARILSKIRDNLKRRVTFVCFSMEEVGCLGSNAYAEQHEEEMKNLRMMMNFDSAGGHPTRKGFNIYGWSQLEPLFNKIKSETFADMPIFSSPSVGGDCKYFFLKGIPTTSMGDPEGTSRIRGRGFGHTRYDTLDKVDLKNLWEASVNGARAILRISNEDNWPIKERRSKEEIEEHLQRSGYIERLKLEKRLEQFMKKKGLNVRPVKSWEKW